MDHSVSRQGQVVRCLLYMSNLALLVLHQLDFVGNLKVLWNTAYKRFIKQTVITYSVLFVLHQDCLPARLESTPESCFAQALSKAITLWYFRICRLGLWLDECCQGSCFPCSPSWLCTLLTENAQLSKESRFVVGFQTDRERTCLGSEQANCFALLRVRIVVLPSTPPIC